MKRLITLCLLGGCFLSAPAQNYVSQAWVADQGNGTYKNPVLYADYSDPDVCRVGDDYYLTSSSFNCCLLYTSPSPRDRQKSRMPSSA